jgi:hypothetical protein
MAGTGSSSSASPTSFYGVDLNRVERNHRKEKQMTDFDPAGGRDRRRTDREGQLAGSSTAPGHRAPPRGCSTAACSAMGKHACRREASWQRRHQLLSAAMDGHRCCCSVFCVALRKKGEGKRKEKKRGKGQTAPAAGLLLRYRRPVVAPSSGCHGRPRPARCAAR